MASRAMSELDYKFEMHCNDLQEQAERMEEEARREAQAAHLRAFQFGKTVGRTSAANLSWRRKACWLLMGVAIALAFQALLNSLN